MSLPTPQWQGRSSSFKPEFTRRTPGYRTPSPPLAYHEPISPQAPDFPFDRSLPAYSKRRKLQDVDFAGSSQPRPAHNERLDNGSQWLGPPRPSPLSAAPGHPAQMSPSPLDVFAAVATSPTVEKPQPHHIGSQYTDSRRHYEYGQKDATSRSLPKQRGSKRTRSEVIDVRAVLAPNARPASSHIAQGAWVAERDARAANPQYQPTSSSLQDLQSDAELLLGFSMGSRAQSARQMSYPAPMLEDRRHSGTHTRDFTYDHTPAPKIEHNNNSYGFVEHPHYPHQFQQHRPGGWHQPWEQSAHSRHLSAPHAAQSESYQHHPHQRQGVTDEAALISMTSTPEVKPRVYRGWPKGKPRGPRNANGETKKTKKAAAPKKVQGVSRTSARKTRTAAPVTASPPVAEMPGHSGRRRHSISGHPFRQGVDLEQQARSRAHSIPAEISMVIREPAIDKSKARAPSPAANICESCNNTAVSNSLHDLWINCNGCEKWHHANCVGFENERKVKEVDKFFCKTCENTHGPTTYVRKSSRAHANVDYAGLHEGKIRTAADETEHHYIQPIKDGQIEFLPETFARLPPELVTADFFERSSMNEPVVIPAYLNPRPYGSDEAQDEPELPFEDGLQYDCVPDYGQDKMDMVIPDGLTVRRAADLYGPEEKVEVIDVKLQEGEDRRWNMRQWADYYEADGDKPVRNVISLEVSQSRLGRLIRRPRVVRDLDLQDAVWPREESAKGIFPKVQFYCLMSVADCYTDFHIDFGGSSVYYHIIKGRKTFFFIPPKPENLKKYEKWCNAPDQNNVFLGNETKECYRVDLYPGDTMLIPSGWIHAVWTPENSLVIGGNFLTRMHYGMQIQINDIEKNTGVGRKFRYPYFQKILWHAVVQYLEQDPIPLTVAEALCRGEKFKREQPNFMNFDPEEIDDINPEVFNARYYSRGELEGLPDLLRYVYRTTLITLGKVPGITKTTQDAVSRSMPKGYGEPVEILKTFAIWAAWKRGNECIPQWAYPGMELPEADAPPAVEKKKSAAAIKRIERQAAREHFAASTERRSMRGSKGGPAEQTNGDGSNADGPAQESLSAAIENKPTLDDITSAIPAEQPLGQRFGIRSNLPQNEPSEADQSMNEMQEEEIKPDFVSTVEPNIIGAQCDDPSAEREQTPAELSFLGEDTMAVDVVKHTHQVQQLLPAISPTTESRSEMTPTMKPSRSKACAQCRLSKRRCVHDEKGRIDPVKAQVPSVPRGPRSGGSGKKIKAEDDRSSAMDANGQANPFWSLGQDSPRELDLGNHARSLGLLPTDTTPNGTPSASAHLQQPASLYPEEPLSWLSQPSPYPSAPPAIANNIDPALSSIDPALEDSIPMAPVAPVAPMGAVPAAPQAFDVSKSRTPSVQVQGNGSTESAATSDSRPSSPLTDVDPAPALLSQPQPQQPQQPRPEQQQPQQQPATPLSRKRKQAGVDVGLVEPAGKRQASVSSPGKGLAAARKLSRGASVVVEEGDEDESTRLVRELAGAEFGLRRRSSKESA